jgi:hypothetical protein
MCLLAVSCISWQGGSFRTEASVPLMLNSERVDAALAAKTDGPARLPVISKITIGALISNSRYLLDAGAYPVARRLALAVETSSAGAIEDRHELTARDGRL